MLRLVAKIPLPHYCRRHRAIRLWSPSTIISPTTAWSEMRAFASLRELAAKRLPSESRYLYEPRFEEQRRYPDYTTALNIRLQHYDFVPLERYERYVERMARMFGFNVIEAYPVAAKTERVQTFRANSSAIVSEVTLHTYDRWIRIDGVSSVRFPLFLRLIQTHAPIGITLTVKPHEKADEAYRYIPDKLLNEKREELKSLDDPNVRKMLGWE